MSPSSNGWPMMPLRNYDAINSLRSSRGLTFVELLIAGLILVIVLGLGSAFISQQTRLQRSVQARNDVQDRVRVVLQVVTQDFSLAGNSVLSTPGGGLYAQNPGLCRNLATPNVDRSCVELETENDRHSTVSLRYMSSQFPAGQECRDVQYIAETDGNLLRSDVPCEADPEPFLFASNVEVFHVVLKCSDGLVRLSDFVLPDDCASGYPRSAVVTFGSRSDIPVAGASGQAITYGSADEDEQTVDCVNGFVCFAQSQEVLLPNLKDR